MDASEVDSVLQAILLGMLVADNSAEDARSSMTILAKLVSNALLHPADPKFQKVNCQNDKIARHICNTPGASEFMDAILFNRVDNEFLLLDSSRLARAEEALKLALGTLPAVAPKRPVAATATAPAPPSQDNEYELRKREAEQRQAQFAKKQEEERKNKERITLQMRQEQREVQSRPVVASKAVSLSRPATGNGGAVRWCTPTRTASSKPS